MEAPGDGLDVGELGEATRRPEQDHEPLGVLHGGVEVIALHVDRDLRRQRLLVVGRLPEPRRLSFRRFLRAPGGPQALLEIQSELKLRKLPVQALDDGDRLLRSLLAPERSEQENPDTGSSGSPSPPPGGS